jgi:hypothetical protein
MIPLKLRLRQERAVPHSYLSHSGTKKAHRSLRKAAKQGEITSAAQNKDKHTQKPSRRY